MWPGVEVARLREPVVGQSRHPFPRETVFLATAPERAMPEPYHIAMECDDRRAVRRSSVIGNVASDAVSQTAPLLGYRLLHPRAQRLLDLRELRLHAVAPTLTMHEELTVARLAANEDAAQESEGLRLA